MEFIGINPDFPVSAVVVFEGKVLESVLTAILRGESRPVAGGAGPEMREGRRNARLATL